MLTWIFFVGKFNEAGCGGLSRDEWYYCNRWGWTYYLYYDHWAWARMYRLICYGNVNAAVWGWGYDLYRILLSIDWLEDTPHVFFSWLNVKNDKSGESAANLFDGNPQTKWCRDKDKRVMSNIYGAKYGEKCWLVEFMSEKPINPTAYYMVTGNDTEKFPGRNPKRWNLYARNEYWWILIDSRDNTNSQIERMADENFWKGWLGIFSSLNEKYQTFRFEIYDNWGDDSFQISEFGFQYDEKTVNDNEDKFHFTALNASDGYPGNIAVNLFDNNMQTKWCSDEDNKAESGVSGEKCWHVMFKASQPIYPTGYHMTTGNDQTAFPGRSPRRWTLYAKRNLSDSWFVLDSRDNSNKQVERMMDLDFWTGYWGINGIQGLYQYFRLEMYDNWGDDCFQISELGFNL